VPLELAAIGTVADRHPRPSGQGGSVKTPFVKNIWLQGRSVIAPNTRFAPTPINLEASGISRFRYTEEHRAAARRGSPPSASPTSPRPARRRGLVGPAVGTCGRRQALRRGRSVKAVSDIYAPVSARWSRSTRSFLTPRSWSIPPYGTPG
jgi:hypothetical protein